jgi:outer membrane protein assembly factor BamA
VSAAESERYAISTTIRVIKQPIAITSNMKTLYLSFVFLVANHPLSSVVTRVQTGPMIESVQVVGYRRLLEKDVRSLIKMRPGQLLTDERVQRDFKKILATGLFDKTQTRIVTEAGVRGGVVITIEVVELPLILNVTFSGLGGVQEAQIRRLFRAKRLNLVRDAVYDPVKVQVGERIIREHLVNQGWSNPKVTHVLEELAMGQVSIEFQIDRY